MHKCVSFLFCTLRTEKIRAIKKLITRARVLLLSTDQGTENTSRVLGSLRILRLHAVSEGSDLMFLFSFSAHRSNMVKLF